MGYIGSHAPRSVNAHTEIETAAITASTLNASLTSVPAGSIERSVNVMYGFKNKLINGNFSVWQRGTTFSTSGYSADRWNFVVSGTGTTGTAARYNLDPLKFESKHGILITCAGGSAVDDSILLSQVVEGVRTFSGKSITLSFWADSHYRDSKIGLEFVQQFGIGGSASVTGIAARAIAISHSTTGDLSKYELTVDIPSIAGKTIGTGASDGLSLNLWISAGTSVAARASNIGHQTAKIVIADVQLEDGDAATIMEHRPLGMEMHLCYWYYQQITLAQSQAGIWVPQTGNFYGRLRFLTKMRRAPAITLLSTSVPIFGITEAQWDSDYWGNGAWALWDISVTLTNVAAASITTTSAAFTCAVNTGGNLTYAVIGAPYQPVTYYLNAEL
jgi:hypothetical protein